MTPDVVVVGSVNLDLRIEVDELPRRGQTVLAGDPSRFSGGKGANQAVALARLGHQVGLVGAVGDDADGDWLRGGLDREGVDSTHLRSVGDSSGLAFVFVSPDGENSIVVSPGANARLSPDAVRAAKPWLTDVAATLAQCEIPAPAILEAARLSDGLFILNPAPAIALPAELWQHVDVVVPNLLELAHLTGAAGPPVDHGDVIRLARQLPCGRVVTTLGARRRDRRRRRSGRLCRGAPRVGDRHHRCRRLLLCGAGRRTRRGARTRRCDEERRPRRQLERPVSRRADIGAHPR